MTGGVGSERYCCSGVVAVAMFAEWVAVDWCELLLCVSERWFLLVRMGLGRLVSVLVE